MKNIFIGLLLASAVLYASPGQQVLISHVKVFGSPPKIVACGTGSPSVVGNDSAGTITTGTGSPTVCSLSFASSWGTVPHCFINDESAIIALEGAPTAGSLVITAVAGLASASALDYFCINHQ